MSVIRKSLKRKWDKSEDRQSRGQEKREEEGRRGRSVERWIRMSRGAGGYVRRYVCDELRRCGEEERRELFLSLQLGKQPTQRSSLYFGRKRRRKGRMKEKAYPKRKE